MSQEKVEVVRRAEAVFKKDDLDAAFRESDPDIKVHYPQTAPDLPDVYHGRDSVRLALTYWTDALDEFGVEAYEYIDADPWVIADVRWHGEGKNSEVRVDVRQADACRVEEGKIVEWIVGYPDVAAALKAVG